MAAVDEGRNALLDHLNAQREAALMPPYRSHRQPVSVRRFLIVTGWVVVCIAGLALALALLCALAVYAVAPCIVTMFGIDRDAANMWAAVLVGAIATRLAFP